MQALLEMRKKNEKSLIEKFGALPLESLGKFVLTAGKRKGASYADVLEKDTIYCDWVLTNVKSKTSPLALFKLYLERKIEQAVEIEIETQRVTLHQKDDDFECDSTTTETCEDVEENF